MLDGGEEMEGDLGMIPPRPAKHTPSQAPAPSTAPRH